MNFEDLESLARTFLAGQLSVDQFLARTARPTIADLGVAQIDLDRQRRCGFPEVVFGQGKSLDALERIFDAMLAAGNEAFATRIEPSVADHLLARFPQAAYNPLGRTLRIPTGNTAPRAAEAARDGFVAILTAGTSDQPVAEEAVETARWLGVAVDLIQDVGVAGPHRLPAQLHRFQHADAVIVVAGMEGALPSVVGGHVACPVVAVPTSVGYGASFGGLAALLGMLNSCASNVTVVNIDAGFKGAYVAGLIARNVAAARRGAAS